MKKLWVIGGFAAHLGGAPWALAALPTWDHIVVVVEENSAITQVLGSGSAPYLDSLAFTGASLTQMYAVTHPSQPNYLQLFSGSAQGVTDDSVTPGQPLSTPNLGAATIAAGRTFTGYSESMPSAGFTGASSTYSAGVNQYVQKHNPWSQWQSTTPTANQLLPATNQPYTSFPSDYSTLPNLSFVVPNEQNDMHDGSGTARITNGDTWLKNNISAYATWAKTHNSLLIVTFDEDDTTTSRNRIPTVLYGANVVTGNNARTFTLHNLLHTLESTQGAARSGASANVRDMFGSFTTDVATTTATFQQGVNSYAGTKDTFIDGSNTGTAHTSDTVLVVDGSPVNQALLRFEGIFGNLAGQVPLGSTIVSAKLKILTGNVTNDNSNTEIEIHRMLTDWSDTATYAGMTSGVSTNNSEAVQASEFTLIPDELNNYGIFDVTSSVQAWSSGATNQGWVLNDLGTDGWRWNSSEFATAADRPYLEISYIVPEPAVLPIVGLAGLISLRRRRR